MERQNLPSCAAATSIGRFWCLLARPYLLESRTIQGSVYHPSVTQ